MGMYDSFYIDCPKCGHELEYQTKSGPCRLYIYGKEIEGNLFSFKYPTPDVAMGLDGQIVRCQFCNSRIKLNCEIPLEIKTNVKVVKQKKYDYDGNYNPKHKDSIKRMKELKKMLNIK